MVTKIAHYIIKYRFYLLMAIALITAFMAYVGRDIQMTHSFAKVIPETDEDMKFYQEFKNTFGEDGNVLVIGFEDSTYYTDLEKFEYLRKYCINVENVDGVLGVLAIPTLYDLQKDNEKRKLIPTRMHEGPMKSEEDLAAFMKRVKALPFYEGQLWNKETGVSLMAVSIDSDYLNSERKTEVVDEITNMGGQLGINTATKVRFAGLPYLRATMTKKVAEELKFFLALSLVVTALVLLFFFRSFFAVIIPLLIIGIIVTWSIGTIVLLGYKVNLLTGLIPPIIVVIGIPNSVYLLNKYHREFRKHGNKIKALSLVIRRIGVVTLITNLTTAIGFIVFTFTKISILQEFGLVAGLNILGVFVASIVLIPALFTYLPEPNKKQLRHLDFKFFNKVLNLLDTIAHHHKKFVYPVMAIAIAVSVWGVMKVKPISHMVDDVPSDSQLITDLQFVEEHFQGAMPLEFLIDTKKRKGVMKLRNLRLIEEFEAFLDAQPEISKPLSLVDFTKFFTQGYYKNHPAYYRLPDNQEKNFVLRYLDQEEDKAGLSRSFAGTSGQIARVSTRVKDIGSLELNSLVETRIKPQIDSIFGDTDFEVKITGTTPIFLKGNSYLISNLQSSLIFAFVLIALLMGALFGSIRMILISILPNIIPLLITGGIMGYYNIPLKPSTAIIFSIAFGIAVDDTIHFLAKYRQELFSQNFNVSKAVSMSIKETGSSMIYTSIILFFGFIIFTWSDFGGTVALGSLTSLTFLFAMITNLTLVPSLLISFDTGKKRKRSSALIDTYYESGFNEEDDEEIDVQLLMIKGEGSVSDDVYQEEVESLKSKKESEKEE